MTMTNVVHWADDFMQIFMSKFCFLLTTVVLCALHSDGSTRLCSSQDIVSMVVCVRADVIQHYDV